MNKFLGKSIRLIIVALLAGLLTPVTAAVSVDTITKTFTVRGANDDLLANARVLLSYSNGAGGKTRPTAVSTNSSGVAAVTVPKDVFSLTYDIIPAAGDVTNAAIQGSLSSGANESLAVKLETANFVVDIQGAGGGAAPAGAQVYYPSGDGGTSRAITPFRTGAFGLRIANNLNTSSVYAFRLQQWSGEVAAGEFSVTYGLKATGASGAQTYTVYTDLRAVTTVSATSGVYVLKYDAATVTGTIKRSDGSAFILPSGSNFANVSIRPVAIGALPAEASSSFPVVPTGSQLQWSGRSKGTPGKYVLSATFPGQLTTPSFYLEPWKNSSNAFGFTESGPFTTEPLDVRIPARGVNFAFKYVVSGTTTPAFHSWMILKDEVISGQTYNLMKMASSGGSTGESALSLADGTYRFQVDAFDSNSGSSQAFIYSIEVVNGVSTLKNSSGTVITKPSDGVYVQSPTPANLKIKAVSAANSATVIQNAYVELFNGADGKSGLIAGRSTGTTTADASLPDGTYMIRVNPSNDWANYTFAEKVVTVSGGVATIAGLEKDSSGVYSIALPVKNFKYTLLEAGDSTSPMLGWINYCPLDSSGNQITCYGEGTNSNGEGGAPLQNSTTYKINVYPPSSSASSQSSYTATVNASGVVSLSPAATVTNSRFVLRPQSANVSGTLVTEANGAITFGNNQGISVQVQKKVNGNWNWYPLGIWRNSGTWGFNITENGEYRILANPQGFADYAWSYSSVFYVSGADGSPKVFSMSSDNSSPTSSITGLVIQVKESNLKLRIIDPRSNELMKYGWAAIFKKETDRETWVMNSDLNSNMPGLTGAKLDNGDYRIEINPQYNGSNIAGLTKKNYDLTVNGSTLTVSYKSTAIAATSGRVTLTPATSNITAKIVDAAGAALKPGNNQWVSVNLQKLNTATNNYDWTSNWANTDKDGFISMTVTDAGTYRLRIEPNGYASSTITTTKPFTVEAGSEGSFNKAFGDVPLSAPSLRVRVAVDGSTTPINFIGVEVRKNNNWLDWSGTGPTGIANIAFTEEGTYQVVVHPRQEDLSVGATRKSYNVTVTKNSAGAFVGVVTGVTATDGIYMLNLGSGNVRGTVMTPTPTAPAVATPVRDAQVVAINTVTKQEMWEYSTNTNVDGKFTMNLPIGTYTIMARSPWGTNSFGSSDAVGTVTVTASAAATSDSFVSVTATTLVLQLKEPTWKGTVMVPGTDNTVVPFAQVCLWDEIRWNCSTANAQGQWALSAPSGFNASLANPFPTGAAFEIGDVRNRVYPSIRKNGAEAVLAFIGKGGSDAPADASSTTSTTLVNRFSAPNVTVTVTAGGVAQPNVWVNLDGPGVGWLGGNSTNAQGIASFVVPNNTVAMNARAEFNGNQNLTGRYAPTLIQFTSEQVVAAKAGGATAALTVALLTPNFNGVVTQTATNLAPVQWSWIELFDDATNQWKGGSNTDAGGEFAMNITRPTSGDPLQYTMVVNPPWNATGSVSKRTYTVTVPVTGDITMKDKNTSTSIAMAGVTPNTYFPMTLGTPSITGTVVSGVGETAVRDSRVTPINASGEWLWQQGQNSKADGAFGLGVSDGNYKIQADVPWGVTGLTRSAQCAVTVTGGAITSAGTNCNLSGGAIKLALREPNLKMKLVLNGSAVPYAHVGIGVGNWNTGSQADAQGNVSLFVDRAAIMAANPTLTGTVDIRVWVDPPYGNSNMVRWDCNSGDTTKPVCATMADFNTAADYAAVDLGSVPVLGPNTKFKVVLPNTNAAPAGSWVALFSFVPSSGGSNWITGGNTDASGNVSFNVETATVASNVRYKVEVNPRWEDRSTYSRKVYDNGGAGFTIAELNEVNRSFAVGAPNVTLAVKGSDVGATANKNGYINIYEADPTTNNLTAWVGGYGLDNLGKVALILAPNKRYRIDSFPGGGITGTRTECFVGTSNASESTTVLSVISGLCGSGTVGGSNALTITLNAGNVTGTVKTSGVAIEGAIVYANIVGASNQDNAVTTTTNSLGKFGLMLDPAKGNWQISIFPINKPGATALRNKILDTLTPPALSSNRDLGDIALVP